MGTEARSSYLLTAVAGGFAVTFVRNETQQHSAALKIAGQNPVVLLPLNSRGGLAGDVVDYSVHAGDLRYDAAGDAG